MNRDIVLVTVDALRHDAVAQLPQTTQYFEDDQQAASITAGAATNWVFPAILSGTYYTDVYNEAGTVRSQLTTLPDVLADNGYATGAFLGFNPYLNKWRDRFDEFWNGGLSDESEEWYSHAVEKWLNRGYRTMFLKKRTAGTEVLERARRWYRQQSSPRFLWIHLMEPHKPYYPGLDAGWEVGLLSAYRSIVNHLRFGDDTPQRDVQTLRRVYEQCVRRTDELLEPFLSTLDEKTLVLALGDHGEEFAHGHYGHERLYDECVRVPLFSQNVPELRGKDTVRQIDLPASILRSISVTVPSTWDSTETNSLDENPAFMLTPEAGADLLHAGVRTQSQKLIWSFDRETGQRQRTEYYDLDADPGEQQNRSETGEHEALTSHLSGFVSEHEPALEMEAATGVDSAAVEARLENLGYR